MCSLRQNNTAPGASIWAGSIIGVTILCTAVILLSGVNQRLFMFLNSLSRFTGESAWANITIFGDGLVAFVLILPLVHRRPNIVWQLFIAAIIAFLVSNGLKQILAEIHRPPGVLDPGTFVLIGPGYRHHSFPSGHTTTAFTLAGVLLLHASRLKMRLMLLAAACLVGFSRVMVGIHWPADIFAGATVGTAAALLGCVLGVRFPQGAGPKSQQVLGVLLIIAALVLLINHHTGYTQAVWLQRAIALACLAGSWPVTVRLYRKFIAYRQGTLS